jgi:hypothetical protein
MTNQSAVLVGLVAITYGLFILAYYYFLLIFGRYKSWMIIKMRSSLKNIFSFSLLKISSF